MQLSFVQLATFALTAVMLVTGWDLWARWIPPVLRLVVVVAAPSAAAWGVRRSRVEGRSLVRTAVGFITLACRPRTGTLAGRPAPTATTQDWTAQRTWITPNPDGRSA